MRLFSNRARQNFIKTLFRATEQSLRLFALPRPSQVRTLVAVVLSVVIFAQATQVLSAPRKVVPLSGTTHGINIYPSQVTDSQWAGFDTVLSVDLSADALYQDFKRSNAAYVTSEAVVYPPLAPTPVIPSAPAVPSTDRSSSSPAADSAVDGGAAVVPDDGAVRTTQPETESVVEEEPASEPAPEPEQEPSAESAVPDSEPIVLNRATNQVYAFFSTVVDLFPFAQESVEIPPEPEPILPSAADDSTVSVTAPDGAEPEDLASANDDSTVGASSTNEVTPEPETESVPPTSSTPTPGVPATTIESTPIEVPAPTSTATTSDAAVSPSTSVRSTGTTKSLVLGDFGTVPLQRGETVKNIQLRASLAGRSLTHASNSIPYVDFVATSPTLGTVPLGSVLLDGEVSNALNGGYFLFAFPFQDELEFLTDTEVSVVFHGEPDDIDGLYLDALWLEVEVETLTREDLEKRVEGEALGRLKQPDMNVLVSTDRDFTMGENPLFNLRYTSQRSKIIEGVRSFLGQTKVKVEHAAVIHHASGEIGITPDVTVTKDGLITVAIPEVERKSMKPGEYTIELTLNEGGKVFVDSFDFQWGLLAINTHQTQYESGDTAHVYAGALSPNGNTICDADLRLYTIDPNGMIAQDTFVPSGACFGNNVTDVPDYAVDITLSEIGTHELYMERLAEDGSVISHTSMTTEVVPKNDLYVERNGPTRIFPPAPYPMSLTVHANQRFEGTLTERIPSDFKVTAEGASIRDVGGFHELTWDLTIMAGGTKTVSYEFDAPDLSPFLYELGPAELSGTGRTPVTSINASSSATSSPSANVQGDFVEQRAWQIASDATGNMLMFWDDGASVPTGWSCVSCSPGQPFYQRFAVGSSTYNTQGGAATHTHTAGASVLATTGAATENTGSGAIAIVSHTHTLTPTIGSASNIPLNRQLRVIQYTAGAGEPTDIPTGAIGIFDAAVPSGWTRYSAQDGYYIRGESTPGTTGGSNTHTHTISGTTGGSAGTTYQSRGPDAANGAAPGHTHTVSGSTASDSNEPPYIEVILGKLDATTTPPNGLLAMWTDEVPGGWLDESSSPGDPFNNRFLKASTSYGVTGGATAHTPADVTGLTTSAPNNTVTTARSGSGGASDVHTHTVNVTGFSSTQHLPPYTTVIIGKRLGTDPVFNQLSYRWYQNANNQTPSAAWPPGLLEGEPISATSTTVKDGAVVRLRLNALVTNATSTAGAAFQLQYGAADLCSAVGTWYDVGDVASSTIWRGYNNTTPVDGSTLGSTVLASTTVAETYEEDGMATSTPNDLGVGAVGEWDFVLQHNGAAAGTNYCFRLVESGGTPFGTYTIYPSLLTDRAPLAPTLSVPFDNEKTASTTRSFYFVTTDPESQDLQYQVQIDNDYDFSSTLEDKDSVNNSTYFENQVVPADKAPFTNGQLIRFDPASTFTNGTTYWWRVRALDPSGSADWGEWSTPLSFTIDTSLVATGWFQTMQEQFDTNTLDGVETLGSDAVDLITGSTTGTMTSTVIDFDDATSGTAWDSLVFGDTETAGDVQYQLQYYTSTSSWALVPDTDLSGNSTGFDTSPVSLLSLDTDTYNMLRIVATLTDSGGSPSIQDWGINWGYRVETPTIVTPFANEKVASTTPLFQFTTSDPQADSLTYQIQWSTDHTFAASTTRTSDASLGFSNVTTGADTDPFISGDTIQFQMQSGDALTNNTTYWWRVRAKDTTGSNAYSFWTEPQSFTVDTTVTVSTWFQTTQEQFDTNVLSGTVALPTDVATVATTAQEALLVYGEGTVTTPRYREWDGSSWSAEASALDVGAPIKWVRTAAGTTREEYVAVTVGTDADVNAQVYSTGAWSDLQEVTSSMGNVNARGFDVAYETLSGDALVVYCDGDADPSYYTWDGSSWTAGVTGINLASANNCEWIELASDPVSNEIILLSRDSTGGQYEAQVWNGSGWGNSTTLGTVTDAENAGMAVEYEESGNQAIIVTSDGNPARFRYNTWNGTTWGTVGTQSLGDDFEWGSLVRDEGTDEMLLCYQDEDTNIGYVQWTGAAWTGQGELLTTTGKSKSNPGFACAYETTAGRDNYAMVVYTDTTQENYSFWNNTTWSTASQVGTMGDTVTSLLERTGVGTLLGLFFDETNDSLLFSSWNGSSWSSAQTIESNASVDTTPYGHPYAVSARNPGTTGTVVVSPAINYTDGSGPRWQQLSWNDSTPGTSDIRYSLQYYNGSTWQFIPDSALSGNSSGFTNSPVDLTGLNKVTYGTIRPYALLTCDGSNNCPTLQDWTVTWAPGLSVSGTLRQYDESTNVTGGTIAVAVNGVVQTGKTGSVSGGAWTISNVNISTGDIITVFVDGAADSSEAVGVTRYAGTGNITGFDLYERHLALGSDDATTTPLTNADVGSYTVSSDEDVFLSLSGSTLSACGTTGCDDVVLIVNASTTFTPSGTVLTHDLRNNGTLTSTDTWQVSGSWDNNATTTLAGSTVVMTATSTTESIDTTGAAVGSFGNLTFGTTTGAATWTLANPLDVDGNLTVTRGTLSRGTELIAVAGNLANGANGSWSGVGTTTFDGASAATWSDANATLQNVGNVVIDGTSKVVALAGNVAAQSITIGADDTLDASTSNYNLTSYSFFTNGGTFTARNGTVFLAATSSGQTITAGGDAFYNLTFQGVGGGWSFTENTLSVNNNFSITAGTVTMPTATTTIAGSFLNTGGTFLHSNSLINFTGSGSQSLTLSGTAFTNAFYDVTFSGVGTYSFTEASATTTNDVRVQSGTLTFPSTRLTLGGSLLQTGGTLAAGSGTLEVNSGVAESITITSPLASLLATGSGTFTFTNSTATLTGDLTVNAGTVVLPSATLTLGGSIDNNATIDPQSGSVILNASATGKTIALGSSSLYDLTFNGASGGWTITEPATTTNNTTLTAGDFTLASGQTLAVGGTFTNTIGGAGTTWTGGTLSLYGSAYSVNTKSDAGDSYDTVVISSSTHVSWWNSSAATVTVVGGGSLYSQDHAAVDGALYIYGTYTRTSGTEHWSYATDFDGTSLSGSERVANVHFASGASANVTAATLSMLGTAAATTTVSNQGTGTYTVNVTNGTTTGQYYAFVDLGNNGLSLLGTTAVTTLNDGSFTVAAPGSSALTVSSTTIDANPALQIFRTTFATTTAISAFNVTQTDGAPSSYWWFRNGTGNLYSEAYDNDTGDPGSVRFDDSSLVITVSGTVYTDAGATPLIGGTCDGTTPSVRLVVDGATTYNGSCSNIDGTYSIPGVVVIGDPTLTVYLNDASGGEYASLITKTPTTDIVGADLYANRVIVRHEDIDPVTIEDLAVFDSSNDTDLRFTAATTTGNDLLTTFTNTELYVWATSTFTPGGSVTLEANATANSYDGSLFLAPGATFAGSGTTTYTIGGSLTQSAGASFIPASSTVVMNATTTGKTVNAAASETIYFHRLTFSGAGGGWNLNGDISATSDIHVVTGTVTGTNNITLTNGSLYGNGLLSLGGGSVLIAESNTLGGTQGWTFNNLTLGNGTVVGTTTPASNATTTIGGVFTIANAHFYDAGSMYLDFTGSGAVFVETGTFLEDTSTVRYSGAGANVISTAYHDLVLDAGAGSATYTAIGLGIQVFNNLTVGGTATSVFDLNTNDPALAVTGDVTILSSGTLSASNSGNFTVGGSWSNSGTLSANGGTITFSSSGTETIAPGSSSFASVLLTGTGAYTVTSNATATAAFTLEDTLTSFTQQSGTTLAVGGAFRNYLGGAGTTWSGTTLFLYGAGSQLTNPATTTESYGTLRAGAGAHIRTWNASAGTVLTDAGGSLYSMDHANVGGDLYIYGDYANSSTADYWSYAVDFDGTALGGSSRQASVYIENGATLTYSGTAGLDVEGTGVASTSIQNQGSGTYGFSVGGTASTTFRYYSIADTNTSGLSFSGTAKVATLSYGDFTVGVNGGTAITVAGTVITANAAKTFTQNTFATSSGVTSAVNVTATGSTVSSWRFTNHTGSIDGEAYDVDPDGDPGYIVWDDSAASITISGRVYKDEGSTVSEVCDSVTNYVLVRVAGLTSYPASCDGTGFYSVTGVTYSPGDAVIAYLNGTTTDGATVTVDPISNIGDMDIYEHRVIVRNEGASPLTIADMAVWDSSDDADIDFTAVDSSPDTLTLPADRKLIVWTNKTFAPGGNVTLTNGGSQSYGGTLELYDGATWTSAGTEAHSIGGSLISGSGASFAPANSTVTFTTSGASRTIGINGGSFNNVTFSGTGSWSIADVGFDVHTYSQSNGTLTLPAGTTTVSGSWNVTGGSFTAGGPMVFDGSGTNTVTFSGSTAGPLLFTGSGNWSMNDTNATSTGGLTKTAGSLTLPSGVLALAGGFDNQSGVLTHNTSLISIATSSTATVRAAGSDLYGVTFSGGGTYSFADSSLTLLDDLVLTSGNLTLATGTLSIGGSWNTNGGTFDHASGTVLFNSSDTGETIAPGSNSFYNVNFGSATGGWTITSSATTTNNFTLTTAQSFTQQAGTTLSVGGVFTNLVGGSATTWSGTTLDLAGGMIYEINTKSAGGDQYDTLVIGANADLSAWNSRATTTTVAAGASFYSQDHAAVDGALYIYGDYHIGTTTEYWSYATDFDGAALGGSSRDVTVSIAAGATTTVDGGTLNIIGTSGHETTITNQGSGTYSFNVSDGTLNAQYYAFRNLDATGLNLSGTPTLTSLSYGDYELAVNGGTLITLDAATLNANASMVIAGARFATTTAITGYNVTLVGTTPSAWTYTAHTGNLDGEAYDVDGATACGSVRWNDSACLLTQQTHYRWRNDDGNLEVPDTEWFDTSWSKRQRVRIENDDATDYTNAVVKLTVPYDADMQSNFADLRFTDVSGTTTTPYWIEDYTASTEATVWVQVPTITGYGAGTVFMYYGNATSTSQSSSTATFIAADDFEDGDISEYSGDTTLFVADGSFARYGSYGLDNTGSEGDKATDGIARFDQTIDATNGVTIRYWQYVNGTNSGDEPCTLFGVQAPVTGNQNYAVCLEQYSGDRVSIAKNVENTDSTGTLLASTTLTYSTGWHEVVVNWTTGSIDVEVFYGGSSVATVSASDSTYSSGGYGFTYWYNYGGWDSFVVRPLMTTEPTIYYGAEQQRGGASWASDLDTPLGNLVPGATTRLRLLVENTGLQVTDQYQLEYAALGAAPSCEAVNSGSYVAVPVDASCGISPICMATSTNFADGDSTVDLLTEANGAFTLGEATEDPSNTADSLTVEQNEYTELEYVIRVTTNVVDQNTCFRVTDQGSTLDTYLKVARLSLKFDPTFGPINFNDGLDISLLPGTTTRVWATTTVTDLNGYTDFASSVATSTMFTSSSTAACAADPNNCYITTTDSQCSFSSCAGNSCVMACFADFYYFADPTDTDGRDWYAFFEIEDSAGGYAFNTSPAIDLSTLRALDVTNLIDYGAVAASSTTAADNATSTVYNIGNDAIDILIAGTDLFDGYSSTIPVSEQKFATSTFNYDACVTCTALATSTTNLEVDLAKPLATSPAVEDEVFWGIAIPFGVSSNPHSGVNTFYATAD